jgi:phosphoserine phosphatase
MIPGLWVATLVAPQGAILSNVQVGVFAQRLTGGGGIIKDTAFIDQGRAADVFFTGPAAAITKNDLPFDVLIQPAARRRKKILIADLESTIIEQEMLDELAKRIGLGETMAAITYRAMNGELDFAAALTERVALLKGQPERLLDEVATGMTLSAGAQDLIAAMKRVDGRVWLVSGGFTFFIKRIAEQLGFDRFFGNELKVEGGFITGEIAQPILDKNGKKELVKKASATYGVSVADILAVGDGANDVPMLQLCDENGGLGVAYRAKPRVREMIHNQINYGDLSALIYAQALH